MGVSFSSTLGARRCCFGAGLGVVGEFIALEALCHRCVSLFFDVICGDDGRESLYTLSGKFVCVTLVFEPEFECWCSEFIKDGERL